MDNAGDGQRGLRAAISSALPRTLEENYGLSIAGAKDLGGSANLNLLAEGRWVVRVYRPFVGTTRLQVINRARRSLADGGIPVVQPIPNRAGELSTTFEDRQVEVEPFVASDGRMNSWERLEAGLPVLGRIHSILQDSPSEAAWSSHFANYIDASEAVAWTSKATARIGAWDPTPAEVTLAEQASGLARLVSAADVELQARIPAQLVHGDFWDNNVLFLGDELVLVADFDFIGVRPRIDDLALTLYYANSEFDGDRLSADRVARLRRLVDAYDSGLSEPLSPAERWALPLAIARQPLWAAGKWLTLLDSELAARRLANDMIIDVDWALALARDSHAWQEAFS